MVDVLNLIEEEGYMNKLKARRWRDSDKSDEDEDTIVDIVSNIANFLI